MFDRDRVKQKKGEDYTLRVVVKKGLNMGSDCCR